MNRLIESIRSLFNKKGQAPEDVERLRVEFRQRYHSFKLLLGANSKALVIMADIEQALAGRGLFGTTFIRSRCTSLSVNVFSMIQNLERLAPHKYGRLHDRFNAIRARIDEVLTPKKPTTDDRLVIPLDAVDRHMADAVGNKMANLGAIAKNLDVTTPAGFAITAHAWQRFLEHNDLQAEIERRIQSVHLDDMETLYNLSSAIQQLIIRAPVPKDVAAAIANAWNRLENCAGKPITVALRSSAVGEDEAGSSFAGQYRSELNVSRENILAAYKNILASKYSLQAITYRLNKGFRDDDIAMGVGCMVMVDARAGGVVYSCNPVNTRDRAIYINATPGLPKSVVDGSTACDLFVVSRDAPMKIIREEVQPKTHQFVCYPEEGVCRRDLIGNAGSRPAIDPGVVVRLARETIKIENFYGQAQDIEWALAEDGAIYILQCRPLVQTGSSHLDSRSAESPADAKTIILKGGICASAGVAAGRVYLVDKGLDILEFPSGSVLVARQALPRWASLLNRATAVVTEQGGFAVHLANVAREFKVPALFSVKNALAQLRNGELVTVDATGLAVHRGKMSALLSASRSAPILLQGSPVYETLKKASRYIIKLNLIDPDSPDFKPQNCNTFHDITRYIHEKAVHEMFNFGRQHGFSERSSKQLHYRVPMQWWILNLDDGFKKEVGGRYVRLENIASLPMLAFWKGFAAIPWEGPPIDGKGLMAVMFQSTANPALTPGLRSKFADRNYFMISKHYCSLSSRLGYHFALLEALVSDRKRENYASFQFKGGAADDQRRLKRVRFIGAILAHNGFRVDIREDNLIARVEAREKEFMLQRIEIIGYLSLHTRQLDMIMDNPARVNYYRDKIRKDIQTLVAQR